MNYLNRTLRACTEIYEDKSASPEDRLQALSLLLKTLKYKDSRKKKVDPKSGDLLQPIRSGQEGSNALVELMKRRPSEINYLALERQTV